MLVGKWKLKCDDCGTVFDFDLCDLYLEYGTDDLSVICPKLENYVFLTFMTYEP